MQANKHYFLLNSDRQYERGWSEGFIVKNNSLLSIERQASFVSHIMDSREKATVWHRLHIDYDQEAYLNLRLCLYTCEEKEEVEQFMNDPKETLENKINFSRQYQVLEANKEEDIILFDCVGRYVWVSIEVVCRKLQAGRIRSLQIFFPKETWMQYLPQVYQHQDSDFLERYLMIFQTLYEDMTTSIEDFVGKLEPMTVDEKTLDVLANWFDIEDIMGLKSDKKREWISRALDLYRSMGTTGYIKELVRLYTDVEPFVVEQFSWRRLDQSPDIRETMVRLYGDSPYKCTIVLNIEGYFPRESIAILKSLIEAALPVYMECQLVLLKPYIFLDQYSYLGINTRLSAYEEAVLNDQMVIPFTTIEKERQ